MNDQWPSCDDDMGSVCSECGTALDGTKSCPDCGLSF